MCRLTPADSLHMHQAYSRNAVPITSIPQFQPVMGNSITNDRPGQVNVPPSNMTNIPPGMIPSTNFMGQLPVSKAVTPSLMSSVAPNMAVMTNPSYNTPPIPSQTNQTNQEKENVQPGIPAPVELAADNQSLQESGIDVKCEEGKNDENMQEERTGEKPNQETMDIEGDLAGVMKKDDRAVVEVKQENEQNSPQSHFYHIDLNKLKEGKKGLSEESGNENVFINPEVCVVIMRNTI